ncbi:ParB N-terminal domain-containing protein [Rhodococcus ruber]|uniref:ParB N-terminal domain-containing protein n=1 Tax=Rhodococcus ruber TaxID=1830 RepID=UPI001786DFCF|nr:ParB N-terminal domain-containing protein [Rhodococcus ruber]MBD8053566.1 ParB N-terminal domain-containing protein [Rhodococcus ruber]
MVSGPGHIELARSLDSINVGRRHRKDLGDIDALAASIEQDDLLQLITIDPEGNLVCGLRRYTAMRKLGWKTTNVWVRTGISDRLSQLLAERDDDALHKPLTQTEAATLFRELKTLLAEDAARRQEASRFTAKTGDDAGSGGGANLAPPHGASGKARVQAAQMVTGRNSYTTLERINRLQDLTADPAQPDSVRAAAAEELERIEAGAGVISAFQRVGAEQSVAELERLAADPTASDAERERAHDEAERLRAVEESAIRAAELERLAAEALARVRATGKKKPKAKPTPLPGVWERRSLRAFTLTWDDLDSWWEHYDPAEVGPALTDEQWDRFEATVTGTVEFADTARTARAETARRTA